MKNKNISSIQNVSSKFRLLFSALIYTIPLVIFLYWLFFNHMPAVLIIELPIAIKQKLPNTTLILAFLVSLIPASVAIYGVINLKELFTNYEKAIIFSKKNIKHIRCLGYTLMCWVSAKLIFVMLISIVLTFNNPPGERMMVAQFDYANIGTLIIGATIVLFSLVMKEASQLKHDQMYTI